MWQWREQARAPETLTTRSAGCINVVMTIKTMTTKQQQDLAAYAAELKTKGDWEAAAALLQLLPHPVDRRIRGC